MIVSIVLAALTVTPLEDRAMAARERIGLPPFAVDDIGQPRERRGAEFDEARSAFQPNEKMVAYRTYLRQQQQFKQVLARSARVNRTKYRMYARLWKSQPDLAVQMWQQDRTKSRNP